MRLILTYVRAFLCVVLGHRLGYWKDTHDGHYGRFCQRCDYRESKSYMDYLSDIRRRRGFGS